MTAKDAGHDVYERTVLVQVRTAIAVVAKARLAQDDSTLTNAALVALVLTLFVMPGVFALHHVPT